MYMFDPATTFSLFLIPFVAMKFELLPDVLVEPFSVSTLVDDFVIAKRVYKSCPIELHGLIQ